MTKKPPDRVKARIQQIWGERAARGHQPISDGPVGAPPHQGTAAQPPVVIVCARGRRRAPSAPPVPPQRSPLQQEADRIVASIRPTWGCPFCARRYYSIAERNSHLVACPRRPDHGH